MNGTCKLHISRDHYNLLIKHFYPGDGDEHGAILLAGISQAETGLTLLVREVHLAREGIDYVKGKIGYRALTPQFIHRFITRARDEKLVYLAAHNHNNDKEVEFSRIDFESHERGYPALLQITKGMPVGALVFGRRSIQADVWLPNGLRLSLGETNIIGNTIERLTSSIKKKLDSTTSTYDRQIKMFGKIGQMELTKCRVAIIGLGGIGSLITEYLARLGISNFCLIDDDIVEESNLSRIIGATLSDVINKISKIEVARRVILQANPDAKIELIKEDVTKNGVSKKLTDYDYIFLAADSMRARLVFNAVVNQYLIPGVQLGSKIRCDINGKILDIISANRPVRPGHGCLLCNQLIDPTQLAKELKTDEERKAQAYGVEEANPSVISLNAISAAHAVNDFLLSYLSITPSDSTLYYEHFYPLKNVRNLVEPRKDLNCSECSIEGRFGKGDLIDLPCI